MPISTTCPRCYTDYSLADHLRGKKVRCKKCGEVIAVGSSAEEALTDEGNDEASDRPNRIQTETRRPSRASKLDDEDERPRRRKRDDWDEPEPDLESNRGLIVGLAVVCAALFLLALLGGGILAVVLVSGPSAGTPPAAVVDVRTAPPQAAPPEIVPDKAPPAPVIVHVSGVTSDIMGDAIQEKLRRLVDPGPHVFVHGHTFNGQMTVHVSPVQDAKTFAAKIDFGTVKSVEGRTITMIADKMEGLPGPNADGVARALFQLKSSEIHKRHEALRKLKDALPDERRAEVCKALEPLINDPDLFTHQWAVEALGVWGTKETVPVLIKAMNDKDNRAAAMKALARLKDERAVEPIASRLEESFDRMAATEALKNFGPAAEDAVLKRLNHHEVLVSWAVCDILKAIGTKKSLPALEKIVAGGDLARRHKAKEAMQAITARQ